MKKFLAMLLVATMLIGLTACGTDDSKGGEDTKATNDTKDSSDSKDSTGGDDTTEEAGWSWPLAEQEELDIWLLWDSEFFESPNELIAIQKIEELTNVKVNWHTAGYADAPEKFSLMVASGNYPDIILRSKSYYSGGLVKMMEDGVTIELTDLLDKYMPNYTAIRNEFPKIMKDTTTDDGRVVSLFTVASDMGEVKGEKVWGGPSIRKDWLDEAGLDIPETIDDWYEALTAIKANHPEAEAPLMLAADATDHYGTFISAFGVLSEFYVDGDTVKFGPAEPGYKEWVDTFRKWYAEGLIDPNFMTNDSHYMASADYIGTGKAVAGPNVWGFTSDTYKHMGYNTDENFWLEATPYPVLNEGDTPMAGAATSELIKESIVITSACENVELAMRYLDLWYSQEIMMLDSLGIEGESYVVNDDGTYSVSQKLHDLVADGSFPNVGEAMYSYTLGASDFGLYNWGMFAIINAGNQSMAATDVWNSAQFDIMYPSYATMTDAESQEYSSLYTNITTLVQENTVKFIMGTKPMEEYDEFVEQLSTYGADRCVELKQEAYNRYINR